MKRILILIAAVCLGVVLLQSNPAEARRARKWKRSFRKSKFGRTAKSKRRGKWVKVGKVRTKSKQLRGIFGKYVRIECRLTSNTQFECQGTSEKGLTFLSESANWPKGKIRVTVEQSTTSMSMELFNKWNKRVPKR
ncbi:MAG TPA: hypothetical protein DCE42_16240 [Myxococcales bacterium]|nr:hypothetical protein [Deltaproteobacteria bacterium]HAA56315.1 hypothetical protein [Myxococcales bacterium]